MLPSREIAFPTTSRLKSRDWRSGVRSIVEAAEVREPAGSIGFAGRVDRRTKLSLKS